jgi:arabinofuranan 3-O-arabinosyltransferase
MTATTRVRTAFTTRIRAAFTARLWPLAVGLAAAACAAVLTNRPEAYVGDNRFEQFWSPGRRLLHEAFIWDGTRDLGRVREDFWPGSTAVIGVFRAFGASPAVAEHLWHATLLTIAGVGMVAVVRLFRRPIGAAHVLAGAFYMFSPFTATFLIPSGLFLPFALAPWLLTAFVSGIRRDQPLRWAAALALIVFAAGTEDVPGLLYALLPLAPAAVYVVHVERSSRWRTVIAWSAGAGVLAIATSAAALTKVTTGAAAFARRLAETEAPEDLNVASSWSETWRGLGYWLAYFRDRSGLVKPQIVAYLSSAPTVVLTFVPAVAAMIALWRSRWRPRLLFASMALLAIVVMVGAYPLESPSPYGRLLLRGYDNLSWLGGLRNTYKAGAGFAMGTAVLLALAVTDLPARVRRRLPNPHLPVALALGLIAVVSFPFWNGGLYAPASRLDGPIPDYWRAALDHLDREDDGTRVLVLPGSTRTAYRWGWVGDDIFDALLRRPHAVPSGVPLSNPEAADVLAALAERIGTSRYVPGSIGPIARRLGIGTIVIRNDLDWVRMQLPRPARLTTLRSEGDLARSATFGEPGENVVALRDVSPAARTEARLPPVEIYTVRDAAPPAGARRSEPPLLVAGDGHAWSQLAERELLQTAAPVVYSADVDASAAVPLLAAGSPLTVSDTNRRRLTLLSGPRRTASHTLADGEDLDRPTPSLFGRDGSQSVAWFPHAERIVSSEPGSLEGFQPWFRAAQAFDGDSRTSWRTGALSADPTGMWVRVDLRHRTVVSEIEVRAVVPPGDARRVQQVEVRFSDGPPVSVTLTRGVGRATFPPHATTLLEVRLTRVGGEGLGPVGLTDVIVPGLDLTERIQLPDDIFRAAAGDDVLASALREAPVTYQFERVRGSGSVDEETAIRRRFRVEGRRPYRVAGLLRLGRGTSDQTIDNVLGGPVGAFGSARAGGLLNHRGGLAVDGRLDSGWVAPPRNGVKLTVRFPARVVDHVEVVTPGSGQYSTITEVRAVVGSQSVTIPLSPTAECEPPAGSPTAPLCLRRGLVGLSPTLVSGFTVEVTKIQHRSGPFGPQPVEIIEVFSDFAGNPAPPAPDARVEECTTAAVSLDGRPFPLRIDATYAQLLAGALVPVLGCEEPMLAAGWHETGGDGQVLVNSLMLEAGARSALLPAAEARVPARVDAVSSTRLRLSYQADGPTRVTTGQSFDERWTATVNGRDLGPPISADALSNWVVTERGPIEVEMRFRPARRYTFALALSAAAVVVCLVLVIRRGAHDD